MGCGDWMYHHPEVLRHGSETQVQTPEGGAQVVTEREDTQTGECDRDINQQFSQQVRHRESTRTPDVQDVVTKLM